MGLLSVLYTVCVHLEVLARDGMAQQTVHSTSQCMPSIPPPTSSSRLQNPERPSATVRLCHSKTPVSSTLKTLEGLRHSQRTFPAARRSPSVTSHLSCPPGYRRGRLGIDAHSPCSPFESQPAATRSGAYPCRSGLSGCVWLVSDGVDAPTPARLIDRFISSAIN